MPFGMGNSRNQITDMKEIESQLQQLRTQTEQGAATSNLSALDFWLITDAGYEPLGMVLGNSVMSMGIAGGIATAFKGLQRGELTQLTQLMYDARELALQPRESFAAAVCSIVVRAIGRSDRLPISKAIAPRPIVGESGFHACFPESGGSLHCLDQEKFLRGSHRDIVPLRDTSEVASMLGSLCAWN